MLERLTLFNEKADFLSNAPFYKKLREIGFKISWPEGKTPEVKITGPDDYERAAFILAIRFFCQNNDMISFANMEEAYAESSLSESIKEKFYASRREFNKYFKEIVMFEYNKEPCTGELIFNTFMYGNECHFNEEHRSRFQRWRSSPENFALLSGYFTKIIKHFCDRIEEMKSINEDAIAELTEKENESEETNG